MTAPVPAPPTSLRRSLPAIFLSIALSSGHVMASETFSNDKWEIIADSIISYGAEQNLVATGNVRIKKVSSENSRVIEGDWLSYDITTNTLKIRGNVHRTGVSENYDNFLIGPSEIAREDSYVSLAGLGAWLAIDHVEKSPVSKTAKKEVAVTGVTTTPPKKPVFVEPDSISSKALTATSTEPVATATASNTLSTEAWDIAADNLIRFENPDSIVASGNVVLIKRELVAAKKPQTTNQNSSWNDLLGADAKDNSPIDTATVADVQTATNEPQYNTTTTIYTDWLRYDVEKGLIQARGNVRIDGNESHVVAKNANIQIATETGTFEDASLQQADLMYMEGKEIEKTGYDTYHVTDGWVITCKLEEGQKPPWAIVSSETDVKREGYAVLKHARFHVKGIPVMYSPYLIIPVKETRQTGFLFPEMSTSSAKGFGLNLPFFWAISESADATFHPQYYADRGFMPGAEFRYVKSATQKGTLNATYLHDELDSSETSYTYQNSDRYWVRAKADNTFGDNWLARLDLDLASDKDFIKEFNSGRNSFDNNQDSYLDTYGRGFQNEDEDERESSLKLLRSWNSSYLEVEMLAINDLRADSTGKDIDTGKAFWKLPAIAYSGTLPLGDSSVSFDWGSEYVNFWREDGYGGHRFDFEPSLSMGLPLSPYLESRAEIGGRGTYYSMENYGSPVTADEWTGSRGLDRFSYNLELEVATTVQRDFNYENGKGLTHQLRPYLRYNFTPEDEEQEKNPFFDQEDRINEQNGLTYGFDTYFNTFGDSSNRTLAHFEMYQTFYLTDVSEYNVDTGALTEITDDLSNINAKLKWYPWQNTSINYKTEYNMYGEDFIAHTLGASYTSDRDDRIAIDYSFKENDNIDEINGYLTWRLANNWLTKVHVEHSLYDKETKEFDFGLTYTQPCWSVTFLFEDRPEDETFGVVFELANIGVPIGIGQ